jgi:hypothetical protein
MNQDPRNRIREISLAILYRAFSIGQSGVDEVKTCIANQAKHQRLKTFEAEFLSFLKRYQVEFDERPLWD